MATEAAEETDGAALPCWDLTDFYPSPDSQALQDELQAAETAAEAFHGDHAGRLAGYESGELARAIAAYEALDEVLSRVMSYAQLVYAGAMSDAQVAGFYQSMQERVTTISSRLVFFTLELNQLDDADLQIHLQDPDLARYEPWIRDQRAFRDHELSEEIERLLQDKQVAGRSAWVRLFDETMAGLRFAFRGEELTSAEILNKLSDREAAARREAAQSLAKTLRANIKSFAFITNTLAKDKAIEDSWRGFARPVSSRNLANFVEDSVVDALVGAVQQAYPRLSHRYYALKARWFGVEQLAYWDRNAPLPDEPDRVFAWEEAQACVLEAYGAFSSEMAGIGRRFFAEGWIDAAVRPGKSPGAFSHPTVPSVHPYILLNYQGRLRDVMTLAHELGHGVHQVLAAGRGHLQSRTPLTLAETASVFGEMLTFRALLDGERDPARRRAMLAGKVEDMLNTVVRQVAMHAFETRLHDERRGGELLPERIGEIWLDCQRESLGPALMLDDDAASFWSYVPHFIHAPFYVYAYAFGDCLVNSLYAVFEGAQDGFAEKYLEMLRAGGSKRHGALLAPFGLDASDPGFWRQGLALTERFIDELEALS